MNFKFFILSLFLLSFSFSQSWTYSANDSINHLISFDANILAGGSSSVSYINSNNGNKIWELNLGTDLLEPIVLGGEIFVASANGKFLRITKGGQIVGQTDLKASITNLVSVFGISPNQDRLLLTTNSGLASVTKAGQVGLLYFKNSSVATPPIIFNDLIIFGSDDELTVLASNGRLIWKKKVSTFGNSRPIVSGENIYVATLDGNIHAFRLSDGQRQWFYSTKGWVLSDLLLDGNLYFGSNDGFVYSLSRQGKLIWKSSIKSGIKSTPQVGYVAGKKVLIVSSNSLYAIDISNGKKILNYPSSFEISDILYLDSGQIIVSARDKTVSSLQIRRSCTIDYPDETQILGQKEIKVTGSAMSVYPSFSVILNLNGNPLSQADLTENGWNYLFDPSQMKDGANILSCTISDLNGRETLSEVFVKRDASKPKGRFIISSPLSVVPGQQFTVYVSDVDNSMPVEQVSFILDQKESKTDGSFNVSFSSPGTYNILISKPGYEDYTLSVQAKASSSLPFNQSLLLPVIVGVFILLIVVVIIFKFLLKKK